MDYVPFNQDEFYRWIADNGDATLRLDYPLNSTSVVVDAGGYKGEWTSKIKKQYNCSIHILEPLKSFHEQIVNLFKEDERIVPHCLALSNKSENTEISIGNDSSSVFIKGDRMEQIQSIDVKEFFETNQLEVVDLMKINIEGGEYDLMERLIELGLHKQIHIFQIQYHRFIEHCDVRRKKIQEVLSESHTCTWNYDWIWENWQIK